MGKINLSDVTFIIPARIDSQERKENLFLVLEFIKNNFGTTIIVLEADKKEQISSCLIDKKIFIEDHNPIFHHTKYRNQLTEASTTPIVAIWDIDVLLGPKQLIKSVNMLRNNETDMVFPYDGRFYAIHPVLVNVYKSTRNIKVFEKNIGKLYLMYGNRHVGGAFIVNKSTFCEAGMENEYFHGWGPEDAERMKRWEILGCRVKRVEGPMFHLYHPRKENSWFGTKELEMRNRGVFLEICRMNNSELINYVKSFKWIPVNKM